MQGPIKHSNPILTQKADDTRLWRNQDGGLHRVDGPAIEYADGTRQWWRNNLRHRDDGPAIEDADGTRWWWHNGLQHRDDGPAIDRPDGTKEWWRSGLRHRVDGPAIEYGDGRTEWYLDGRLLTAQEVSAIQARLSAIREKQEEERQTRSAGKIQNLLRLKTRQQAPRRLPNPR